MYESVTPNPTGSLSGPYFLQDTGGTVTGTEGAQVQVQGQPEEDVREGTSGTVTGTEGAQVQVQWSTGTGTGPT